MRRRPSSPSVPTSAGRARRARRRQPLSPSSASRDATVADLPLETPALRLERERERIALGERVLHPRERRGIAAGGRDQRVDLVRRSSWFQCANECAARFDYRRRGAGVSMGRADYLCSGRTHCADPLRPHRPRARRRVAAWPCQRLRPSLLRRPPSGRSRPGSRRRSPSRTWTHPARPRRGRSRHRPDRLRAKPHALARARVDREARPQLRAPLPSRPGLPDRDRVLGSGGWTARRGAATSCSRETATRPLTLGGLARLASQVRAQGIRRVDGRILGDESFYDARRTAPGWKARYFIERVPAAVRPRRRPRELHGE